MLADGENGNDPGGTYNALLAEHTGAEGNAQSLVDSGISKHEWVFVRYEIVEIGQEWVGNGVRGVPVRGLECIGMRALSSICDRL